MRNEKPNLTDPLHPNEFLLQAFGKSGAGDILQQFNQPEGIPERKFFLAGKMEDCVSFMRENIPVHRQSYYVLVLLRSGTLKSGNGLDVIELREPGLLIRSEGEFAQIIEMSPDVSGYFSIFDRDFLQSCFSDHAAISGLPFFGYNHFLSMKLSREQLFVLEHLHGQILEEYIKDNDDKSAYLSSLFALLVLNCKRFSTPHQRQRLAGRDTARHLIDRFTILLRKYAHAERTVAFYADALAVSSGHLNKVLKQITGRSAKDHILEASIAEARVLLKQTQLTISEVAYNLSFEDVPHFTRTFKKISGQTPMMYRHNTR